MLLALLLTWMQTEPAPTAPAPEPSGLTLPILYHERLVFLRLGVNGGPERLFLLDTGASASALALPTADELALPRGEPMRVEGTAGVVELPSARLATLGTVPFAAESLCVSLQDLSAIPCPPGERLDGILGADFLARFVVRLDFVELQLTLGHEGLAANEGTLALQLDHGIPRFAAQLDDLPVELRLDTGASLFESTAVYINIPQPTWEELQRADPELVPETQLAGTGLGGAVTLPVARIQALIVGDASFARPFVVIQPRAGYFARPDALGFVGNNFLEKFEEITLDYPARKLRLGPLGQ